MPVYINLAAYLSHLKAVESSKPQNKQKEVPSISELARTIGMHQTSLSRIANNHVNQLNLDTADKIITEMRRRGFPMQVSDLIMYREPDELSDA